jgi:hypothetical protein
MEAIDLISQDLFDKIRSRFKNLELGDETGNVTIDPRKARFFDFDFVIEGNVLGRVSISINEGGSLKIFYGQGILEDQSIITQKYWFDFLKEMRKFAKSRLLRFDTRDITKSNLNKEDFRFLASKSNTGNTMQESRIMDGTSRTSYSVLERTKLIIKHSRPVDETQRGARSRNIDAIFIENSIGERFKYPFLHLAGARAMQRHVANEGRPYDDHGKKIIEMSEEIAKLTAFERKVPRNDSMQSSVNEILERTRFKLESLRTEVHNLSKQRYYENWKSNFNSVKPLSDDDLLMDQATLEDYKNKFTVNSFNEELMQYFPLIHKVMKETGEIDLNSLVTVEEQNLETDDTEQNKVNEFSKFEEWTEKVAENHLTDDIINALKELIDAETEIGTDGTNAIQSLRGIGIEDRDLEDLLKNSESDGDFKTVIGIWLNQKGDQNAIKELDLDEPTGQSPADADNTPPADQNLPGSPDDVEEPQKSESKKSKKESKKQVTLKDIAEMVKSFYNREDGTFPLGETGVQRKVEKALGEKAGKLAGELIRRLSERTQNIEENLDIEIIKKLSGIKK